MGIITGREPPSHAPSRLMTTRRESSVDAAYCVPDLTPHVLSPLRALLGRSSNSVGLPSPPNPLNTNRHATHTDTKKNIRRTYHASACASDNLLGQGGVGVCGAVWSASEQRDACFILVQNDVEVAVYMNPCTTV